MWYYKRMNVRLKQGIYLLISLALIGVIVWALGAFQPAGISLVVLALMLVALGIAAFIFLVATIIGKPAVTVWDFIGTLLFGWL